MASVDTDLAEGINFSEDPSTGRMTYVLPYHVKDLEEGTTAELIAQALSLVPQRNTPGPIPGTYVAHRVPEPWPPLDCIVHVNYSTPQAGDRVGNPVRISVSTS